MPIKLSKRTVDALAAGPLPSIGYDTELKGFGVRLGLNVVGEQLLTRCTSPCVRLNATGIVTGFPPPRGVSVIFPKY